MPNAQDVALLRRLQASPAILGTASAGPLARDHDFPVGPQGSVQQCLECIILSHKPREPVSDLDEVCQPNASLRDVRRRRLGRVLVLSDDDEPQQLGVDLLRPPRQEACLASPPAHYQDSVHRWKPCIERVQVLLRALELRLGHHGYRQSRVEGSAGAADKKVFPHAEVPSRSSGTLTYDDGVGRGLTQGHHQVASRRPPGPHPAGV